MKPLWLALLLTMPVVAADMFDKPVVFDSKNFISEDKILVFTEAVKLLRESGYRCDIVVDGYIKDNSLVVSCDEYRSVYKLTTLGSGLVKIQKAAG